MIAIHPVNGSFSDGWIRYCEKNNIPYRLVNCYESDIINHVSDCDSLMWHYHHAKAEDYLMSKQLLNAIECSGKHVFPDYKTAWHFDDKIGQKYLLESLGIPMAPAYVFYSSEKAIEWAENAFYPKVFKLRSGAGSVNVKFVKNKIKAKSLIRKAFSSGFKHDSLVPLSEMFLKYFENKVTLQKLVKSFLRQFIPTEFAKVHGREKGYIYFQDFIPDNFFDIRVIVIGDNAFAIKRMVRKNDFRASGSGNISYEKNNFDNKIIKLSFDISEKIGSQCLAYDFVFSAGVPLIVEISYGFSPSGYLNCPGYWDSNLLWHEGEFDPYGWMVELMLRK